MTDPLGGSWFVEQLTDTIEREAITLIDEIDRMGDYRGKAPERADAATPNAQHPAYARREGFGRSVINGINRGYFRRSIAEASYRFSEECEAGDRIIVGVNAYTDSDDQRPIDILTIPHEVEVRQVERLAAFKAKRNKDEVKKALDNIRAACQGKPVTLRHPMPTAAMHATNVMPALVDGALSHCTLGEMVQAMADVYGRYTGGPEW